MGKDLYEDLLRFYEFQLGQLPNRQEFKQALQATLTEEDLRIFFLLPFFGMIPIQKLEQRALRARISPEELHTAVQRLAPEGLIDSYVSPSGRLCGRSPFVALLEFQVRLKEDSPMRAACVKVMNAFIEGALDVIPTHTPYYRVLPVEATITGATGRREIAIHEVVPDLREVLPIDIVSEMIREAEVIVVADCYCRSTKRLLGEDCGHLMETCFYFNRLALIKLETEYARRIDYDEALHILRECEEQGLVHNVSNCEDKIQTLCNCCVCSCAVMRAIARGQRNVGGPSRFVVAFDESRCTLCGECIKACHLHDFFILGGQLVTNPANCIGCGQCVSKCPEGALRMVPRQRSPKIYRDNDALLRRINTEAMLGLALRKLRGR